MAGQEGAGAAAVYAMIKSAYFNTPTAVVARSSARAKRRKEYAVVADTGNSCLRVIEQISDIRQATPHDVFLIHGLFNEAAFAVVPSR